MATKTISLIVANPCKLVYCGDYVFFVTHSKKTERTRASALRAAYTDPGRRESLSCELFSSTIDNRSVRCFNMSDFRQ